LLTNRRVLAVVNVGENELDTIPEMEARVRAELCPPGSVQEHEIEVLGMSVQIEAEAAQLEPADRAEMLEALGLGEGALTKMVRSAFHLLGLRTYFTTGEKETRAWTFHAGDKAPVCAGKIHSDIQRGFIRAEVIHWDELIDLGSWNAAKDVGKLRSEGKEYEFVDGDVTEFRFNV
jgi:ribosome-binding ATPase YchF (GTP1/OBG family)